jgi:hypothetical protein
MPQSEPSFINHMQRSPPPCSKCGALTMLVRIEPAARPGHDLRTFNCTVCPNADTVEIRCR